MLSGRRRQDEDETAQIPKEGCFGLSGALPLYGRQYLDREDDHSVHHDRVAETIIIYFERPEKAGCMDATIYAAEEIGKTV